MMDNPKPLGTKLDSGTIPNGLEGFWIRPSFQDLFLSRRAKPLTNITIRNFFIAVPRSRTSFCRLVRTLLVRSATSTRMYLYGAWLILSCGERDTAARL
jgi:hypothetical protein